MSRHGKIALDSFRLNFVVPDSVRGRLESVMPKVNARSMSECARLALEYGLARMESLICVRQKRKERNTDEVV